MNLTGHGHVNQMTKSSAVTQSQMQAAHMGPSASVMANASANLLGQSPQRGTKQPNGYGLQANNITSQISGRAGLVVSALGAPTTGQASSLQSALGGTFNGRNSSGLLYMHHGSLNSIAQVNGGAATGGAMASQQSSIGNQAAAAMQTASI